MEQYILKSALLAEIEKKKKLLPWGSCASQISMECNCKNEAYDDVISLLDTIETKEVDLEIPMWVREVPREDVFDDRWFIGFDDYLHRKGYKIKICDLWKLPKEPLNV